MAEASQAPLAERRARLALARRAIQIKTAPLLGFGVIVAVLLQQQPVWLVLTALTGALFFVRWIVDYQRLRRALGLTGAEQPVAAGPGVTKTLVLGAALALAAFGIWRVIQRG
jgi:hypothetical protein